MDTATTQSTVYNLEALSDELKANHALLQASIYNLAVKVDNFKAEALQQVDSLKNQIESALCEPPFTSSESLVEDCLKSTSSLMILLLSQIMHFMLQVNTSCRSSLLPMGRQVGVRRRLRRFWTIRLELLHTGLTLVKRCRSEYIWQHIDQISIDHVPKELIPSSNHAPWDIIVWGIVDEENNSIMQHPSLADVFSSLLDHSPLLKSPLHIQSPCCYYLQPDTSKPCPDISCIGVCFRVLHSIPGSNRPD